MPNTSLRGRLNTKRHKDYALRDRSAPPLPERLFFHDIFEVIYSSCMTYSQQVLKFFLTLRLSGGIVSVRVAVFGAYLVFGNYLLRRS